MLSATTSSDRWSSKYYLEEQISTSVGIHIFKDLWIFSNILINRIQLKLQYNLSHPTMLSHQLFYISCTNDP